MVVQTRSKSKILREILSEEEYSKMFRSLNLRCRRGGQRAARAVSEEEIDEILDPNYNPVDDNINPPNVIHVIQPPVINEPSMNVAVERRNTMEKIVRWFQFVFYLLGILVLVFVIYKYIFDDDDDDMEFLIQRRRRQ